MEIQVLGVLVSASLHLTGLNPFKPRTTDLVYHFMLQLLFLTFKNIFLIIKLLNNNIDAREHLFVV